MSEREPRETKPRPGATEYDDVEEYVHETDPDPVEERREIRAGETTDDPGLGPSDDN